LRRQRQISRDTKFSLDTQSPVDSDSDAFVVHLPFMPVEATTGRLGRGMSKKKSNVLELGDKSQVRAALADRRRRKRLAISTGDGQPLAFEAEERAAPRSKALSMAIIFEWGALGALWGGLFGFGFSMVIVPLAILGREFLARVAPVVVVASLVAAVGVSVAAMIMCVVCATAHRRLATEAL